MFRSFLILIICLSTSEATKRFARVTGLKCLECHTSRKGGSKNLREKGQDYKSYHLLKNELRRSKLQPTDQNLNKLLKEDKVQWRIWNFWFALEKELKKSRARLKNQKTK